MLQSYVLLYVKADGQEEEVALRREDAVIFVSWDRWKARSKVRSQSRLRLMIRNYKLFQWITSESRKLRGPGGYELRNWLSRLNRRKLLLIVILLVCQTIRIKAAWADRQRTYLLPGKTLLNASLHSVLRKSSACHKKRCLIRQTYTRANPSSLANGRSYTYTGTSRADFIDSSGQPS